MSLLKEVIFIKGILIIAVLAVIVFAGYLYYSRQYKPALLPKTTMQTNTITIQNFSFNPKVLTVKQGTTVTWINQDSAVHTIKSETFNSSDLNQGDKFEFTFNDRGSFDYTCGIHPSMQGKIIVE